MTVLRRRIMRRIALLVALCVFMTLGAAGGATALWSAQTAISAPAEAARLGVVQTPAAVGALGHTYDASTLSATGFVTVLNSGTRSAVVGVVVAATSFSSPSLPAAISVSAAVVASQAACTSTAALTGATGTLDPAAPLVLAVPLASGSSATVCIRTAMTSTGVAGLGGSTLSANVTSSVTAGSWTVTAAPSTFAQSVAVAQPSPVANQSSRYRIMNGAFCVSRQTSDAQVVLADACGSEQLSQWLLPGASDSARSVRLAWNTGTDSGQNWAASSPTGSVVLATAAGTAAQRWSVELRADGHYRFVNEQFGLCLSVSTQTVGKGRNAAAIMKLATCDNTLASQGFDFQPVGTATPPVATLACRDNGTNWLQVEWPELDGYQAVTVYRIALGGILIGTYDNGYSTKVNVTDYSIPFAQLGAGTKPIEITQSVHSGPWNLAATGAITIQAGTNNVSCG